MLTYEEMGKLPADRSVIPGSCYSFAESAFYVTEAAIRHMNKFFEEVGITELAIFEATGSVVVYEGEKMKNFWEGLGKVWDKIMQAIKGAFENLMNFVHEKQKDAAMKVINKIKASDIDKIDDKKFSMTLGKTSYIEYAYKDVQAEIDKNFNNCKVPNLFGASYDNAKSEADEFVSHVYGDIYGGSDIKTLEDLKKAVKEACAPEGKQLTKDYLKHNLTDMLKTTTDLVNSAKSEYTAMKRAIDKNKRELRSLKDDNMDVVKADQKCKLALAMAHNTAIFATYDAARLALKQNMSVLRLVAVLANSKAEPEATSESTNFIEEAFNW